MANSELDKAPTQSESRGQTGAALRHVRPLEQSDALDRFAGEDLEYSQDRRAVQLLRSPSLSARVNGSVCAIAFKSVQRSHGNRFVQRAIADQLTEWQSQLEGPYNEESLISSTAEIPEEPARVQREPVGSASDTSCALQTHDVIPEGSGEPMDAEMRPLMESRFGADFSDVRLHTDSEAAAAAKALDAEAYTFGRDIYFAQGRYSPHSRESQHLLAHELTHTIQQSSLPDRAQSASRASEDVFVGAVDDPLEQEAEDAADLVVDRNSVFAHQTTVLATSPGIQRQGAPDGGPKVEKTTATLPEGQNIGFLANGDFVIRTSWWGVSNKNPEKLAEVLRAMKAAQYYWWMTDAQIEYISANFEFDSYDPKKEFAQFYWGPDILRVIGPPPGADFMFERSGQAIQAVIRSSAIGQIPTKAPTKVRLPNDLKVRLLDALDKYTGIVSAESDRAKFVNADNEVTLSVEPKTGSLLRLTKDFLDAIYGPERYDLFLKTKGPGLSQPKPVKTVPTGGGKKLSFDMEVSDADMEYATKWLAEASGAQPTWGAGGLQIAGKTYYQNDIDIMREIDKDPRRAAILDKLRGYNGDVDSFAMRWAINAAEYEAAAKELGVEAAPTGGQRVFPEKVQGQIIVEGYAYPGRENRIWFKKSNLQAAFLFEIIKTQWVVEKKKDGTWEKKKGPEERVEFNAREPNYFKYDFQDGVGTYRINAFVNHNWFFPAHITELVEVKTEEERLSQVKGTAFGGMGEPKVTQEKKDFDTSLFNEVVGSERFDKGKALEGNLPADWQRLSDADRLKFITTDKDNLNKLIKQYDTPGASYAYKNLVDYARNRLKSIEEQESKITGEKKEGFVFFEARGAYLSRTDGVPDGPLKLIGMAKGEPEKMKLVVHDFTRLFEPTDFVFEAEGGGFSDAAEAVFLKLCKRYPAGRMSVLFETINNANVPQKRAIGFELDTNTAWKAVRSVVWDPTVTIAVNLAGAALIIFAPPSAAIVLPVLAIYNSIETVSKMAELEESGSLTKVEFAKGVAEIGLNVLPVIGEFKALSIAARTAAAGSRAVTTADRLVLYGLHGATVGGMLVLMTANGVEQCKRLQEQDVSEVARLMVKLEEIRKRNPNSPEIGPLEADLEKAKSRALSRAEETFKSMAKSLALILVPTAAMSKIAKTMVGKNVDALIKEGTFVHQEGVPPHYDPVEGVMKGDKAKVNAEVLEGLKADFAADQGIKQAQLEKMAGTDKVEIRYTKGAKDVSVSKNADGFITIEAPEGTSFDQVFKGAWDNYFSKQAGAPADMPKIAGAELEATNKGKVIATQPGVQVGRRIESLAEAQDLLRRIGDGDQSAFSVLGAEAPGKSFDPQSVEWGLGQTADRKYVIIRGDRGYIDWSKTPEVKPVAHTHPMSQSRKLVGWNITFADLAKGAGENAANADRVMPSPADIKFMVENGLTQHTVQTPYVSKGNGVIGNPTRGTTEPKINIEIVAPERTGLWHGLSDVPVYKAKLRATADGSVIWEGDVWATHHPEAGSQLMFNEPSAAVMTKPKPGALGTLPGGGTAFSGSHGFTPTNEVQTRAFNDWTKLQQSPRKYQGKFLWEDWLYQYEKEGLIFDLEARRWKTPEGTVKKVELFSADAKAADVVKRLTTEGAGADGSTSTFKSFFETCQDRHLIKDAAELESIIEREIEYKGRSVDFVRHKLKEQFKPRLMDQASPARWDATKLSEMQKKYSDLPWQTAPVTAKEAAGHREMADIVKKLDSSDKGSMFEQWQQENIFPTAKKQIAATKGEIDKQLKAGQELGADRRIDLLNEEEAIEVKSGDKKLPADEVNLDSNRKPTSQLLDYLRMIGSEVKITVKGQIVQLKKLRYSFSSTKGAIANLDTIKAVLGMPEFEGKVAFEVVDPTGIRRTLRSLDDLGQPELAWLTKKQ
jgi:hypothetical protein